MKTPYYNIQPGCLYGDRPEKQDPDSLQSPVDQRLNRWWSGIKYKQPTLDNFSEELKSIESHLNSLQEIDSLTFADEVRQFRLQVQQEGLTNTLLCRVFALIAHQIENQLSITPHDEQYFAAWNMLQDTVVEMNTGEGKTLTICFPAIVAALTGIPVHVITVNDYLVERDAKFLNSVYRRFNLTVGIVTAQMNDASRRQAYKADIVYCTNKQIVFDYLRDLRTLGSNINGLSYRLRSLLNTQGDKPLTRGLCFAIVDEADSVLIDEARTPLILSESSHVSKKSDVEGKIALGIARTLHEDIDFKLSRDSRFVRLTESGLETLGNLSEMLDGAWRFERYRSELIKQALTALHIYQRDRDYLVVDNKVILIDENTGRAMPDRKLQNGLHRVLEIKEKCKSTEDTDTLASISFQRFFLRYHKLTGISGTLSEVSSELRNIYQLNVVRVPTHKPNIYKQLNMVVLSTRAQQIANILEIVKTRHQIGQPILIGTRTVELSQRISSVLHVCNIPHQLLNAAQDQDEAQTIAQAGQPGAITVATNMAGRGTDIPLHQQSIELGGLHVINTEINESSRTDRQLFGRAARQGDPGSGQSILSATDELIRDLPPLISRTLLLKDSDNDHIRSRVPWPWIIWGIQRHCERQQEKQRVAVFHGYKNLKRQLAIGGNLE